jgi:hypothetical protein
VWLEGVLGRYVLVAGLGAKNRRPPDVAVEGHVVGVYVGSVEAAREAAHDLDVRVPLCGVEYLVDLFPTVSSCPNLKPRFVGTYHIQLRAQRLLTKHMLPRFNRLDRLLSMRSGNSGYTNGLKTFMLEHLIEVGVDLDTPWLEILLRPCNLVLGWCESCYELGFGCAVEEVIGVTGAHAAEA